MRGKYKSNYLDRKSAKYIVQIAENLIKEFKLEYGWRDNVHMSGNELYMTIQAPYKSHIGVSVPIDDLSFVDINSEATNSYNEALILMHMISRARTFNAEDEAYLRWTEKIKGTKREAEILKECQEDAIFFKRKIIELGDKLIANPNVQITTEDNIEYEQSGEKTKELELER